MNISRKGKNGLSRRRFFVTAGGALGACLLAEGGFPFAARGERKIVAAGPASKYKPKIQAAFVRRESEYGMRWPGQIYDGKSALKMYLELFTSAAESMGAQLDLPSKPIYSLEEAGQWVDRAKAEKPDGLFVILLDRQEHAWPAATLAAESGIPTVIYSPVGSSFTTNTVKLAKRDGLFISSTDDARQPIYGMKMICAAAKLREMRFIVLKGDKRYDTAMDFFNTRLRYVPANAFLEEYQRTPTNEEVNEIANQYMRNARRIHGAQLDDVKNGVKSYIVARTILEREEGDGITMDCLGALGKSKVSLPCIAWSRMLDCGIPAACEADLGAALTHAAVQYLFDRPGFQQDPVAETAKNCLIGAHCTCATRLNGFSQPPEPYHLSHHHGNRDAVPIPEWRVGNLMTSADIVPRKDAAPQMIISSGTVVDNVSVPPAGGCVVSVMVQLDGVEEYLDYPGFHQIFFYGDYKKELRDYCRLYGIEPVVV